MKTTPIIFSGEMVRALLDGRKTQTRRVFSFPKWADPAEGIEFSGVNGGPAVLCAESGCFADVPCPYGVPDDLLYVRETWCPGYFSDGRPGYRADWHNPRPEVVAETTWRPSIHMPRWASRITLQLTDVRVERVQDISSDDCIAEGVGRPVGERLLYGSVTADWNRRTFHILWDSLNAKRGYSWESNPWVWALTFAVHKCNVDAL